MSMKTFRSVRAIRYVAMALVLSLCILVPAAAEISDAQVITLNGNRISADVPGVYSSGSTLTITLPGEYLLKGNLTNGQILVDCEQKGKVRLYFSGVSVNCSNGPALYIKACSPRLTIDLVEGTDNKLSDGKSHADSELTGVIYSKSDLTISGTGKLTVTASYRNGIVSKDDLRIKGGKINVQAVNNGISGKDCVEIYDGEITVKAGNDGIKTTNEDPGMGYIFMEGGIVDITCGDSPLSYVNELRITGGSIAAVKDPSLSTN